MSSTQPEQAALWQVRSGASDGTEATAGDANTIKFNKTNIEASGSFIYITEILLRNSSPENTSLQGGVNEIEDMGTDGVDIQLTGEMKNVDSDLSKLIRFWKEDKTVPGYTKGRFGLRIDDPANFNVVPTATYGYHIINPRIIIDNELRKVVKFVMTLRLGGDVTNAI